MGEKTVADLDESEFDRLAGAALERFAEALDEGLGAEADVDFSGGILTITLESGGQYVLNKHAPNRQIWLSSPRSGASHYRFEAARGAWVDTRSGRVLAEVLAEELTAVAAGRLALD
ncbi:MAG: iron donor protein CyaY [Pseudomonadota bacterium]